MDISIWISLLVTGLIIAGLILFRGWLRVRRDINYDDIKSRGIEKLEPLEIKVESVKKVPDKESAIMTLKVTRGNNNSGPVVDKKNKKAKILIPENLSEGEKELLRQFYDL